jgi:tRNA (Thr-GGU) A37 N-methylase/predicted enzyme related to lactoylglutathione lyase
MEMNQVTAQVTDLERAERFYTGLGLTPIVRTADYVRFECPEGGSTFSLERADAEAGSHGLTVYFEFGHDLDEVCSRLAEEGVAFDQPSQDMPWLWREARLEDPDGNRLCLFSAGHNRRYPPWRLEAAGSGKAVTGIELQPIGHVVGGRSEPIDDHWLEVESTLELDETVVGPDATKGLSEFSHVEVVYLFHLVDAAEITTGSRRPRGRADWPEVGILAQRAKMRPNRIGATVCQLISVDGLRLQLRGLDAIDGTPVLDVKPYMSDFGPIGDVREPVWATELMEHYWQ